MVFVCVCGVWPVNLDTLTGWNQQVLAFRLLSSNCSSWRRSAAALFTGGFANGGCCHRALSHFSWEIIRKFETWQSQCLVFSPLIERESVVDALVPGGTPCLGIQESLQLWRGIWSERAIMRTISNVRHLMIQGFLKKILYKHIIYITCSWRTSFFHTSLIIYHHSSVYVNI